MGRSRFALRATRTAGLPLLGALLIAACGGVNETSQVRAKVEQFATAAHIHDYATICHSVLSGQLLADIAAGGVSCEKAVSLGLASVRDAGITIGTITVTGPRASVLTVSQAHGEKTALTTLELAKGTSGWRITSLGNAAAG